ncbi:hypothetical protein ACFYVL_08790 [Streptomyces sp. NPDC004111]|uniref:hypothetical protein n=1 Tax=Streptomyces sp. NPDC004111 TaxID=3364690 RepID=UPI0036AB657C
MRTLLRHLLDTSGRSDYAAFLPDFKKAARERAAIEENPSLCSLVPALSTWEGWYYGQRQPQKDARRVLTHMLGYSIEELWSPAPEGTPSPAPAGASADLRADKGAEHHEMRRTAAMAARRAADFALGAERGQIGPETLGLLTDTVADIVDQYPKVPLAEIWDNIAEAQDDTFRLIEGGRARPSQTRDLHFLATVLSVHMAKASHDMGDEKSAMVQARAAGVCAQQAEHGGLIALTYGLKSLITYWSGKGTQALHYARQGAAEQPDLRGTVGVWLAGLEARAAALLGDEQAATTALHRAQSLRERVTPDDLDAYGGLLTFPQPKHLYYDTEARVLLGRGDSETNTLAEQAVDAFADPSAPHWAFGDQAGARCNLALIRLHGGEIDGAAEALRPVLDLQTGLRNRGIIVSAERVGQALLHGPARDATLARDLHEEIEAYGPTRPALPR